MCCKYAYIENTAENMRDAREEAYTEIANLLYKEQHDSKKRRNERTQRLVPACIRIEIRQRFPDPGNFYFGFDSEA